MFATSPFELKQKSIRFFQRGDFNRAIDSVNEAIFIYKKQADNEGLSRCYNNLGLILWDLRDTATSLRYYRLAQEHAAEVSLDLLSKVNNNIGGRFLNYQDYGRARYFFMQNTTSQFTDRKDIVNQYLLKIAHADIYLHNFEEAEKNLTVAGQYYESKQDAVNINYIKNLMLMMYTFEGKSEPKIVEMINNVDMNQNPDLNIEIANYFASKKNFNMSNLVLLGMKDCKDDSASTFTIHFLLAENYLKMRMPVLSQSELDAIEGMVCNANLETKIDYYDLRSEIYKNIQNYDLLKHYDSLRSLAKDEQMMREKQYSTLLMENLFYAKFQIQEFDSRIQNYEKELFTRKMYIISISGLIILLAGLFIMNKIYRRSQLNLNKLKNSVKTGTT